ncbi:MAG: SulP family inorganic anion transporter [Bacteroidetes bacterium]|jgi:MFS superfamily sulfate permease-like transporter|nr:SulP family inorganic anion transporter [Bacteroidota bacterium]
MDLLNKKNTGLTFKYLKNDLPSGLVVFLVALPLCLGIALASGAPLFSGIIAGMIGGTVVAFTSGSALSVSGPAAGLTVIVVNAIHSLGSYEVFLLAVVLAGLIQIVLGFLKAGVIGYYFPSSVIKGMLAAIGIILILKQIPHALGYDKDNEGDFDFLQSDGQNTFSEVFNAINFIHPGAVIIAVVSLFILIMWDRPFLKKYTFFKVVPGALFVVILGILINEWFRKAGSDLYLEGDKLVRLPVANSASEFVNQFTLPDFSAFTNYKVYVVAITIAIIASLESLLSIEAADKLDPYKRNTPTNRELKAQGLGNFCSGMIGGLPLTAVIVRSSANINSGAKTKLSSIIHGFLLLLSVIVFAGFLNKIPLACLAALLLVVGYKLAKISLFTSMYRLGWEQFLPFIVTVIAIQFSDLLKGIGIGMAVAIFFILRLNYKRAYFFHKEDHHEGEKITIRLAEDVSFLNKGSIALTLDHLPENSDVTIDGTKTHYIDLDVLEMLHDFKNTAELKNIKLTLLSIPEFKGVAGH